MFNSKGMLDFFFSLIENYIKDKDDNIASKSSREAV